MWPARFTAPLPIRCRGRFHLYGAEDGGARVLVVVASEPPAGTSDHPGAVEAALDRLAAAHGAIGEVAGVARLRERGPGFVSFACDARADGETLVARMGELRQRVDHAEALTVIDRLSGALAAAHTRGFALGPLGWCNVIVDGAGELWWLGFGHNVCTQDETGALAGAPGVFVAPETAAGGGAASSAADVHAFFQLQQALLPFAELPPAVQRAFAGQAGGADDRVIAEILAWIGREVLTAPPDRRATLDDARRFAARERAHFGIALEPERLRARLAAVLDAEPTTAVAGAPGAVTRVAADGAWIRLAGGEAYEINHRAARRLLAALARRRVDAPGGYLDAGALVEAGWPGERPLYEAGRNRLYVALSMLRKLGLRALIERDEPGYRLDPGAPIAIEPA